MKFLKFLGFDPEKHNVRTEIIAGLTTFLTMAYILAVNPNIFDALGGEMSKSNGAVFTATAIAAVIGTLAMAFIAKKPFALAPGMGLNAFFVYTVCLVMGHSWQFALTAVFIEGIIFIILTVTNVRKWIVDAIPISLKHAIGAGIGLFIAFIGFQNAGIVVNSDATLVTLGLKLHDASGAAFINGTALLGIPRRYSLGHSCHNVPRSAAHLQRFGCRRRGHQSLSDHLRRRGINTAQHQRHRLPVHLE